MKKLIFTIAFFTATFMVMTALMGCVGDNIKNPTELETVKINEVDKVGD